jgi:dipeptidyl aminopeptidase/acylaminoacyl peptidase
MIKKKITLSALVLLMSFGAFAQDRMTPELLWSLNRVSGQGITKDGKQVIYAVTTPDIATNKNARKLYSIPLQGGKAAELTSAGSLISDKSVSPDGKHKITVKEVKIDKVYANDYHPDMDKANVQIYNGLNHRHWDSWEDGAFNHIFVHTLTNGTVGEGKDIMEGEPFDSPTMPFGGEEDYTWSPDSKSIIYVSKKKAGTDYAVSTNTDLYEYNLATGQTKNLTEGMMGYDTEPAFSATGALGWLSMKRDGFESDKNDIIVRNTKGVTLNLTQNWDGTVNHFKWSNDGKKIYFVAPVKGTIQLFEVDYPANAKKQPVVKQITNGDFDVQGMLGQAGNSMVVSRTDMNHAAELYTVNLGNGQMQQLTNANEATYNKLKLSKIEKRWVPTTDGKQMLVWVIFPPDFDASKKYPTLLYCQGGPQAALTQSYSYRWNFQLLAANGYIVVAPNRRGMPGHGVAWNEQISKDHGGQVMDDYLSAIDAVAEESYVDKSRLGAVGASYGGYSVFYLAGIHNNRFKTFISHAGIFNTKSMFGSTEEIFFTGWDYGAPYWDKSNALAQKAYTQFDPSSMVDKWNTPILIIQGGKDFRVPEGQAFEAFTAAQLRGIKSRLVYIPEENHWILSPQNAIVWQREFFNWLGETMPSATQAN